MIKEGMTLKKAVYKWVSEMNQYPTDMIHTLMDAEPDDWMEVTTPDLNETVYVLDREEYGRVVEILKDEMFRVVIDDAYDITTAAYNITTTADNLVVYHEYNHILPKCKWMWAFGNADDELWLKNENGIHCMLECGFRVYQHEEWGYFFGIDGVGYDFYEKHWIPLYWKRGLMWHDLRLEVMNDD